MDVPVSFLLGYTTFPSSKKVVFDDVDVENYLKETWKKTILFSQKVGKITNLHRAHVQHFEAWPIW